ncbi:MAG: hypothetical protein ACI9T9_002768 [Oleiphilaceae bacterium]|jgi:hypothetical protein
MLQVFGEKNKSYQPRPVQIVTTRTAPNEQADYK